MARSLDQDEQAVARFVREAVAAEAVWGIRTPNGFAVLPANSAYATTAILFWSSEPEAASAAAQFNEGGTAADRLTLTRTGSVPLYRWLTNMPRDFACPGPNWSLPDLAGPSVRCSELLNRIEERLSAAGRLREYRERYDLERGPEGGGG